ncbi:hypothetical protein KPH14_008548 [Odynerus spinipes]|uniref:limulus clotting factor C n=1 Tax=Odynerus spinipes TaxID=1348599 RepID=A0AAD9RTB3_9HYME|nr:hypothetical protein KPH14_008548 [Odynerus spinipes]
MYIVSLDTESAYHETNLEQSIQVDYSVGKTGSLRKHTGKRVSENPMFYDEFGDVNENTLHAIYSLFPDNEIKKRFRRETRISSETCQETASNCKTILRSVNAFMEMLKETMPMAPNYLQNLGYDPDNPDKTNSKLLEIMRCLECQNRIDESVEFDSTIEEDDTTRKSKAEKNVQVVINLLDGKHDAVYEYDSLGVTSGDQKTISSPTTSTDAIPDTVTVASLGQFKRDHSRQLINDRSNLKEPDNASSNTVDERSMEYGQKVASSNSQMILPTAEVFQSSQQVELKPTMTWMPYPVCFYGPPQSPQPAGNSAVFPASYPSGPYPAVPQQHTPTSGNAQSLNPQPPNFLQIQTQNVQLVPPPDNVAPWMPLPAQRVPTTGPGRGSQYYCTYLPAPTFQFPTIPGVSEFQRMGERKGGINKFGPPEFSSCPLNTFMCAQGNRCVSKLKLCDGHVDCPDGSDEKNCSCRDRVAKSRLCDGYIDCPNGEDETECYGCPKDSFSCYNSRYGDIDQRCIPLSKRCDGSVQCSNKKDEVDCSLLLPTFTKDTDNYIIGYTEGYLHQNYEGKWYPVCSSETSLAEEACRNELGVNKINSSQIIIRNVSWNNYRGPYSTIINNKIQISDSCTTTATYVKCPPYPCGLTLQSQGDRTYRQEKDHAQTAKESTEQVNGQNSTDAILGVVGGRASEPAAWPFLIAIYKDGHFHCGGVILNENWVLTAAHCLIETDHYYEVQAGMLRRFSFSPMAQSRTARVLVIHPNYDPSTMRNDIGMIMLNAPLHFNRWVRPACLPDKNIPGSIWKQVPPVDTMCVVMGWGALTENGPDPDQLREVEVPILPLCAGMEYDNVTEICAGYPQGGRDACQGDSGGPLLCMNPYVDLAHYVAGIISHGEGCARPGKPGIYTKVSYFVDWVKDITGGGHSMARRKGHPLSRCPSFLCHDGKCLPQDKRCDLKIDCLHGEDEEYCHTWANFRSFQEFENKTESNYEVTDEVPVTDEVTVAESSDTVPTSTTEDVAWSSSETSSDVDAGSSTLRYEERNFVSTITEGSIPAVPSVFTCQLLIQSIPMSKRCDKILDCEDGTDELNCTCKDTLSAFRPEAICDGHVDCEDRTDEENCQICSEGNFLCRKSRICIPLSKKCDTTFDCPLKEDELDCFTLSNGEYVNLDDDGRPILNVEGVLTRNWNGKWHPTCHRPIMVRNQSSAVLIGDNMCEYFGFESARSVEEVTVLDMDLESRVLSGSNETYYQPMPTYVAPSESLATCPGLYIRCRPVPSSSANVHLMVDPKIGNRTYIWPWLAAVFIDGVYRCPAILLEPDWLLCSSTCTENLRLSDNYTTVLLGYSPSFLYVNGPHQQTSVVDEIKVLNDTGASLIHLKTPVNLTRHVQALFLEKRIYPPNTKDNCVAIGTDDERSIYSVFLRPVLKNCQKCHRCFVNATNEPCTVNEASRDWSGVIFCHGIKGWYPASVFHEKNPPCSFQRVQILTSIDYLYAYLTQAMEDKIQPYTEPTCNGVRCNIGQCVPWDRVCDGVSDCRSGVDESVENCRKLKELCQNDVNACKCAKSELQCGSGECISKNAFCDGNVDCIDGSDEKTGCDCAAYLKLTAPERLCDGRRHCLDKSDESSTICSCRDNDFRCKGYTDNEMCIPQDFVCDGDKDCPGGEDEAECRKLKQSPFDPPGTGEILRRSFGVWYTECFPTPIKSDDEASEICKTLGYVSGGLANQTNTEDSILAPIFDNFYIVRLNDNVWVTMRNDKPLIRLTRPSEPCHRVFLACTTN